MISARKRKHSIFTNLPTINTSYLDLKISDTSKTTNKLEPNLLPLFSKDILKYTLNNYLMDDPYTKLQLSLHHQFSNLAQYSALWKAVVEGNQALSKKIIKIHPEWLFECSSIKDLSGRIIENVTPFELAYGADDLEMLQMMLPYLDKLENGRKRAFNQIKENFTGSDEKKPYDFTTIVAAITANRGNPETAIAVKKCIEQFKNDFSPEIIKRGQKHFNMQILFNAYQVYINNYGAWSFAQSYLYLSEIITCLLKKVPASYAQAYCQGLDKLIDGQHLLKRNLKLYDGTNFYFADLESNDFFRCISGRHQLWPFLSGVCPAGYARGVNIVPIKKYVEQKQFNLSNLLLNHIMCQKITPKKAYL